MSSCPGQFSQKEAKARLCPASDCLISAYSSDDSTTSPEAKKPKKYDSPLTEGPEQEEDEVMTALIMSEEVAAKVQKILEKLEKLDTIELSLKKIESKLAKLETRTTELKAFKEEAKKDFRELKDGANFAEKQLLEKSQELAKAQAEIAELTRKVQKHEEAVKETESKSLYLEAYSRRENIKFMNIEEGPHDQAEDIEEILRGFLERELGYVDAQNVEFQRVHRTGKTKDENPLPILALFLRYRLKGSKFQMFRDLPTEIVKRRRVQMETFKTAKRRGIPAAFSQTQPGKWYIRGRLWPVGKELPP